MPSEIDKFLNFLSVPKNKRQIIEQFSLSNSRCFHLLRWLEKAKLIKVIRRIKDTGVTNRTTLYVKKD